jgi:hypothetical protein
VHLLELARGPRRAWVVAAPVALVLVAGQFALLYDGSQYLFRTLDRGAPFIPHGRLPVAGYEALPLAASRLLGVAAARWLHVLVYGGTIVASIGLTGYLVRDRAQRLLLPAVVGSTLLLLPGLVFVTAEGTIVSLLAWPLLAGVVAAMSRRDLALTVVLAVVVAVLHVGSWVVLGAVTVASLPYAWRNRGRVWLSAGLAAVTLLRVVWPRTEYEQYLSGPDTLRYQLDLSLVTPNLVLVPTLAGALLLLLCIEAKLPTRVVAALSALAAVAAVPWAADAQRWGSSAEYRGPAMVLTAGAVVAVGWLLREPDEGVDPRALLMVTGATAAVLVVQAVSWHGMLTDVRRLAAEADTACVTIDADSELAGTVADYWGVPALSALLQGRAPDTLVYQPGGCEDPMQWNPAPGQREHSDWFDLPVVDRRGEAG